MPVYEYRCTQCRRKMSVFFRSAAVATAPRCERCGSDRVQRLFSTFALHRSEAESFDDIPDDADLDTMADSDPKTFARMMRKMGQEAGEDMGPEFDEMVGRLEAGESLEGLDEELGGGEGDALEGADGDASALDD